MQPGRTSSNDSSSNNDDRYATLTGYEKQITDRKRYISTRGATDV